MQLFWLSCLLLSPSHIAAQSLLDSLSEPPPLHKVVEASNNIAASPSHQDAHITIYAWIGETVSTLFTYQQQTLSRDLAQHANLFSTAGWQSYQQHCFHDNNAPLSGLLSHSTASVGMPLAAPLLHNHVPTEPIDIQLPVLVTITTGTHRNSLLIDLSLRIRRRSGHPPYLIEQIAVRNRQPISLNNIFTSDTPSIQHPQ